MCHSVLRRMLVDLYVFLFDPNSSRKMPTNDNTPILMSQTYLMNNLQNISNKS